MLWRSRSRVWTPADATVLPVTLADVKDHLRVTGSDEDYTITSYIGAAAQMVEVSTQRLLTIRSATLLLPGLPDSGDDLELPGGKVQSLTSFTVNGVAQSLSGYVVAGDSPARLIGSWPSVTAGGLPVSVVYVAGYTTCPPELRQAVLLIVGELYRQRATGSDVKIEAAMISANCIMDRYRIRAL